MLTQTLAKNLLYEISPKKAKLDELYLISLGKRQADTAEWYTEDLDQNKLQEYLKPFNLSVHKMVSEMGLDRPI
jgi:hypothetical protein